MSQLTLLYDLQMIDTEFLDGKARLGEVIESMKEPKALVSARALLAEKSEAHQALLAQQRDLDLQVGSIKAKLKASEEKLYSGKVTNSKELTDMQAEVQSLTRRVATAEDQILEVMSKTESAEGEKDSAETTLNDLVTKWESEAVTLNKEKNTLAVRLNALLQKRKTQIAQIDKPMFARYEKIRKKKRGLAVVTLKLGNSCSGCSLTASSQDVKAVGEGKIVYCPHCSRMIVSI